MDVTLLYAKQLVFFFTFENVKLSKANAYGINGFLSAPSFQATCA